MAIVDQLTVATEEFLIPGAQNQIFTSSNTVNALLRFARFKKGAAGNGIRITGVIDRNSGVWYSGMDDATRNRVEKLRAWFALWYNRADFAVLAGTDIEENLGKDSEWFLDPSRDLSDEPPDVQETTMNLAGTEIEGAIDSGANALDYALWNGATAEDTDGRVPEDLDDLFNENGAWHGLANTGLGDFGDHPKDPWTSTAPGQASLNIHEPRIFVNPLGAGTDRTITKKVLQDANNQMGARVKGFWFCGLDPDLFGTLQQEWDGNIQIPMGAGTLTFNEEAIQIGTAIYFRDTWAPTGSARHVHVGMPNARNGSFYPCFWTGASRTGGVAARQTARQMMMPTVPGTVANFGQNVLIPFYSERWQRDQRRADAISAALKYKMSWVCTHRWMQYEVRDLAAA